MIALCACVALAFFCEAIAGFGGTVLALALGAQVVPIEGLLPALVPVNLLLSAALGWRGRRAVAWPLLLRGILPAMALGLPIGLALHRVAGSALRPAFAVLVVGLAALEGLRLARVRVTRAMPAGGRVGLLLLAGVVHGAWGTGGPLAVLAAGGSLPDKRAFRSTLSALWIVLHLALLIGLGLDGRIDRASLRISLALTPVVFAALCAGEWCFSRIPERPFRVLVAALLGVAGALLLTRGA